VREVAGYGGLSFLIYPWGFIVQGMGLWHFVKRRPENYWLYIIIVGGVLGAGVYMIVEVISDLGLLRGAFQGFGRRSRIQALEIQILDNPSAGNLEELAELNFEQGNFRKAREALNRSIALRTDSPHAFYLRAKSSLAMSEYAEAIVDLEYVVAKDPKFDYHRATGLLGDAYARTGDLEKAGVYFAPAAQDSTTPETLYNYANYLRLAREKEEALEWLQKLAAKKKTLPTYMRPAARPWFKKGKALQKELAR
jgi:hypothetical protein